jgi:4-alpha-glucanotransferase
MKMDRASGLLLHITSLPGGHACGTFGPEAYRFIDFLACAGQSFWQVLPLAPTGYGDSPYSAFSAFAGNDILISPDFLCRAEGLTPPTPVTPPDAGVVDYGSARGFIRTLLRVAATKFQYAAEDDRHRAFTLFCDQQQHWLDDYALFMALHEQFNESWVSWPQPLQRRDSQALAKAAEELADAVFLHRYIQFVFAEQWRAVHAYARTKGVRIIGDLPIFVAYDSADVWAHQELFLLDDLGQPLLVAGVPPDYFSRTGQRWGNPLYDWSRLRADGFSWWQQRLQRALADCDVLRIDHFRGFEACWAIPAAAPTAEGGSWVKVPGAELFGRLQTEFGTLPLIAEDLGVITPEVEALRDRFGLPGMKILQFAFDSGPDNPYLPANYPERCVVYTGTHDNTTSLGWWQGLRPEEKGQVRALLDQSLGRMPWDLIVVALNSPAAWCIVPVQDLLGLAGNARMNQPGCSGGNWAWRCADAVLTPQLADELRAATGAAQRIPASI